MKTTIDPKDIQRLGLTEREAKVYVALVNHGPLLPKQIPTITLIPQGKTYEILHRLQNRGLVTRCTINLKKLFEAVRPDDVVQSLLIRHEHEIEASRQAAARLEVQMMSVFNEVRGTPSVQSYFTFLQNSAQILRTVKELQEKAQEEILGFNKAPYVMKLEVPSSDDLQIVTMRRGVRYRTIYEADELQHSPEFVQKYVLPFVQAGEEARVCPELSIKLAVFDNQFTLFQFVDKHLPEHRTSVIIENEGVALCFAACFEFHWQKSVPIMEFLSSLPPEPASSNESDNPV